MAKKRAKKPTTPPTTDNYEHTEATVALRPDAGTQAQFKKQKPNQRYRYDSSLSPALEWDGQNSAWRGILFCQSRANGKRTKKVFSG